MTLLRERCQADQVDAVRVCIPRVLDQVRGHDQVRRLRPVHLGAKERYHIIGRSTTLAPY